MTLYLYNMYRWSKVMSLFTLPRSAIAVIIVLLLLLIIIISTSTGSFQLSKLPASRRHGKCGELAG